MRIGIFGGSFDPVHFGHLYLAHEALDAAKLDKLFFMPVKTQPFKQDRQAASGKDRIEMLKLAFKELGWEDKFEVSDFELTKDGISYTIETLRHFKSIYPEAEIFFLMGEDSVMKVDTWKCADELLTNYSFVIGHRPGYDNSLMLQHMSEITEKFGTKFILASNRQFDISSTYIRENVYNEDLPDDLVPISVERYIEDNELYR